MMQFVNVKWGIISERFIGLKKTFCCLSRGLDQLRVFQVWTISQMSERGTSVKVQSKPPRLQISPGLTTTNTISGQFCFILYFFDVVRYMMM